MGILPQRPPRSRAHNSARRVKTGVYSSTPLKSPSQQLNTRLSPVMWRITNRCASRWQDEALWNKSKLLLQTHHLLLELMLHRLRLLRLLLKPSHTLQPSLCPPSRCPLFHHSPGPRFSVSNSSTARLNTTRTSSSLFRPYM